MPKITKSQQKRLVSDISSKAMKLYIGRVHKGDTAGIVSTKDMEAIERLCAKWMKRIA